MKTNINENYKISSNPILRLQYYQQHGFDETAKNDEIVGIRLKYYEQHGFDEAAKNDENSAIRLGYYDQHGFTDEMKQDFILIVLYQKKLNEIAITLCKNINSIDELTDSEIDILLLNNIKVKKI